MARLLRQSDPLEAARAELAKLREADDWDEPTPLQVHVNVPPAAKRTPAPPAQPGTVVVVLQTVGGVFKRMPPWGAVVVAVVLIVAWAYLAVHGKAPVP